MSATERIIGNMTDRECITRLERRARELQTAVVAIIEHLEIEEQVAAAERSGQTSVASGTTFLACA
jgi:hypothetical protein